MRAPQVVKRLLKGTSALVLAGSLLALALPVVIEPSGVPNPFNPNETQFQHETHFLVFTGSDTAGETAQTATAYYNAIDPSQSKRNFTQWLVNAGFISDPNQWHPTGPQQAACNLPGCDYPAGTYGDNIINTDSHAIVLNAADLGFVRNQYIRCVPSCTAPNPKIYTYLENYPVAPFAQGGSNFGNLKGGNPYPTTAEAAAAIQSALNRPSGDLAINPLTGQPCTLTADQNPLQCKISRIADVAFEWAPPPTNPSSSTRYGQLYSFIFNSDSTETIALPATSPVVGNHTPNVATGALNPINAGDPFPPNLDFLGFKQHPGVCFICHGGNPKNLTSTGAYPQQGNVNGFRLLPLDIRNLLFTSDSGPDQPALPVSQAFTDRANQEAHIKVYNLAVLKTVPTQAQFDGQVTRVAHLREAVTGWYTDSGGTQFGRTTQDVDFIPAGWRESIDGGTAPAGSEHLYETVLSPSCRSCHFNREITLDFGTAANFRAQQANILQMVLGPLCKALNPQAGYRPMPLAHLTYQRFWQANNTLQILPYPNSAEEPQLSLFNTAEQIATYFGYTGTAAYCQTVH